MSYISRFTGKAIDDYQHTVESLITIFTTPKRTRVYLRGWGSNTTLQQDALATEDFKLDMYHDIAEASRLEPRFKLEKIDIDIENSNEGEVLMDIYGLYLPGNKFILLEGLRVK